MTETTVALHELTATAARAAMHAGRLSPVALVEALLERIAAREPQVQAWVRVDAEGARAAARAAEAAWRAGTAGPLTGLPVGIKDIYLTAGMPTSATFAPLRDYDPGYDATAVARLRAAGAIVLGKTETTQFALLDPTRTRNPWNLERTPGGSSSGSAAAVADRMVPVALGSQTVGSVLRPAAYCGVFGFKPSYGRISRYGILPLAYTLDHPGILARSVADVALIYALIAGPDPRDPTTLRRGRPSAAVALDGPSPRIVVLEDIVGIATPDVAAHFGATVERLAAAGARVRRARLPLPFDTLRAVLHVILQVEAAAVHAQLLARHREHYAPKLRGFVEVGTTIPGYAYIHAQRLRRRIAERVRPLLRSGELFATPTASNVAPDLSTTGDNSFQGPWSLLGWPSISLPSGISAERLPLALQLVGAPFREDTVLQGAQWCAERLGYVEAPAPPQ
jgi:aspartyl-tRNA(Asn)/glutamyl-tRNA(Gln) amidotransferase subunit A